MAQAAGLHPADYGMPPTLPDFLTFTKRMYAEENPQIVALLKALRRNPPPAYVQLRAFITQRLQDAGLNNW